MTGFRVIVADPPWEHGDALGRRGAAHNYSVMPTINIAAFPLPPIADDAILFLWRLSSMISDALLVASQWGFVPKAEVVWYKQTKLGKPWFGMGRTVRNAHETAMVCVRGRGSHVVTGHGVRSVLIAPVPIDARGEYIHSAKPDEFFDQVVNPLIGGPVDGGPCLEVFARRRRADWTQVGDELPPEPIADDGPWGYTW